MSDLPGVLGIACSKFGVTTSPSANATAAVIATAAQATPTMDRMFMMALSFSQDKCCFLGVLQKLISHIAIIDPFLRSHPGKLRTLVSIGRIRKRFPVAAKIALVTAGMIAEVPGSPIPPGGSE